MTALALLAAAGVAYVVAAGDADPVIRGITTIAVLAALAAAVVSA